MIIKNREKWTTDYVYQRIQHLIELKSWSLAHLAAMAAVSENTLGHGRKAKTYPSLDTILGICDALHISPAQFFDDENAENEILIMRILKK